MIKLLNPESFDVVFVEITKASPSFLGYQININGNLASFSDCYEGTHYKKSINACKAYFRTWFGNPRIRAKWSKGD